VGDERGAVVAADERRLWIEACELLQQGQHILGLATPSYPDGQAQTAVIIDHVQELQPPTIHSGIELEVHGQDLMAMTAD